MPTICISFVSIFLFLHFLKGVDSATFTILNQCNYAIWPGILSGAGTSELPTTGFTLQPGDSNSIVVPPSWSGRIWGRTYCTQDIIGRFTCATADCGSGTVECAGAGAAPPATLAEFTLNGAGGLDFYDISLVDGYNVAMSVTPEGGTGGNCSITECVSELNNECPKELRVVGVDGRNVGCKSGCEAFGKEEYCCKGELYGNPNSCKPTKYSEYFKNECPKAYSYAYDDQTSTFTCASSNYLITFCPSPSTSLKSSNGLYPQPVDFSSAHRRTSMAITAVISALLLTLICQPPSTILGPVL